MSSIQVRYINTVTPVQSNVLDDKQNNSDDKLVTNQSNQLIDKEINSDDILVSNKSSVRVAKQNN